MLGLKNASRREVSKRLLLIAALMCTFATSVRPDVVRAAEPQDDAATGQDAGGTFETATPVPGRGLYGGRLDRSSGDTDDYFKFFLPAGGSTSILLTFSEPVTEPVTLLDPHGVPVETGTSALWVGASASTAATTEVHPLRLSVHHAAVEGDYRLHVQSRALETTAYEFCFMNCEQPMQAPIDFIFGGSLATPDVQVLLVPPQHGDLGNPAGPTVFDYIDATLRGIHRWENALEAFAADHPQFAYLADISVDIEIFDGVSPVDPAGYDVVIGYVAAGPVFRGVASQLPTSYLFDANGDALRFSGRVIALSLFGASPRAGQVLYDFPEINDLEGVTMHEFGHTFGLGHTLTWHHEHGPDLMNSPATFVYGDGSAVGDGGERTQLECFSSLDLYGMAHLYRWLPSGQWEPTWGSISLPPNMEYELYC